MAQRISFGFSSEVSVQISRRSAILSALAAPALAAAAAEQATAAGAKAAPAALLAARSPVGDVVGKVTVGYQGWFSAPGDGSSVNHWWHYGDASRPPSPTNAGIKSWPDVRELTKRYQSGYGPLGNGSPAELFSSYDSQTVDTHFRWLQEAGIDTAALQRFGDERTFRNGVAVKMRTAAEAHGRKFYIMYDISGWTTFNSEIPSDWRDVIVGSLNLTASSAYARQSGKPVVCVWGMGYLDRPGTAAQCLAVIQFLQAQGCYVIGGVPREWRHGDVSTRPGFEGVYAALDMLSPWMVGAISDNGGSDSAYTNLTVPDLAWCDANGVDYQPCILPGDLQGRQRRHGDFMWRQFYNMTRAGAPSAYISMFDEYNEGNQIAKTAESQAFVPGGSGILALDEDGTACSSDYYLRLTGDGGRMLKGQLALTATRPTPPIGGGTPPTGATSLRARANGRYVTAGAAALIANATAAGTAQLFDVVDAGGGNVALKARANGSYVCAENAGAAALIANRAAIGGWETFQLIRNSDGSVSLKALANGNYVCAENAGAAALIANRAAIGLWESFDLISS